MSEIDSCYLKLAASIGAIFGQFPVKNLKGGILKHDQLSPWGIWNLILLVFHIVLMQTLFPSLAAQQQVLLRSEMKIRAPGWLTIMSRTYLVSVYAIYFIWLWSLPKFLELWKSFQLYGQKYSITKTKRSSFQIFLKIIQAGILWFETIINAVSFKLSISLVEKAGQENQILNSSWISRIAGVSAFGWLSALHMCIIQFPCGLAIQFILEFSQELTERIDGILDELRHPSNYKQFNIRCAQVIELMDIFDKLRRASNLIILTFLSVSAVLITGYTFLILVNTQLISSKSEFAQMAVYFVLYFLFAISKVFLLTNSGESLMKKGEELRRTILKMSPDMLMDSANLTHLKFLALDIDFQLSGYGYFRLNRTALTGILSSVITYNVVLAQFEASSGGGSIQAP